MIRILGIFVAVIFAVLSLFHFYWALGGRFGSGATVPTTGETRVFNPSPFGTFLVAIGLLMAMFTILGHLGLLGEAIPRWVFRWGTCGIGLIFFLRAVGEFRLVGFFKRQSPTLFAYWDTRLFSPLCLLIALIAFTLVYSKA